MDRMFAFKILIRIPKVANYSEHIELHRDYYYIKNGQF